MSLVENPLYAALLEFLDNKFDGKLKNLTISYKNSSRKRVPKESPDYGNLAYLDIYFEIQDYAPRDICDPEFPEKWRDEYIELLDTIERESPGSSADLGGLIGYWDVSIFANFGKEEPAPQNPPPKESDFPFDGEEYSPEPEGEIDFYERLEANYVTIKITLVR